MTTTYTPQKLSEFPYSTNDPEHPYPADLVSPPEIIDPCVAEVFGLLGESPEALRGFFVGMTAVMSVFAALVSEMTPAEMLTSDVIQTFGPAVGAIVYAIERSPEFAAAVAILEGGAS